MLTVGEVWRYPVKSLAGELVPDAWIDREGMRGDRTVHVRRTRRGEPNVVTGRSVGALLPLRAGTGEDGEPRVGGHDWRSPEAEALVREVAGPEAELAAWTGPERFDMLPLLVATDAEIGRWGADRRRLRPNLVVDGAAPHVERTWPGRALHIGRDLVVGVDSVRLRCVVTTYDPDTGEQDLDHLRRIHREFDSRLALNCWVIRPGLVRTGDAVEVRDLEPEEVGSSPGYRGWITGAAYAVP